MTFVSFGVPKVAKVDVLESLLVPFFGDFLDYGSIVKMELSLTRELNLEGSWESEII